MLGVEYLESLFVELAERGLVHLAFVAGQGREPVQLDRDAVAGFVYLVALSAEIVEHGQEHPVERGHALARLGRKVGAAVEWLQLGRQEDRERPAGRAGQDSYGLDVDFVYVGTLLPVDLDAHVVRVQDFRDLRVRERLAGHHVTPVAG